MKPYPTYRQREALQILLPGDWMPLLKLLPIGDALLATLLRTGWIEQSPDVNAGNRYRITEAGRTAFRTPVPTKVISPRLAAGNTKSNNRLGLHHEFESELDGLRNCPSSTARRVTVAAFQPSSNVHCRVEKSTPPRAKNAAAKVALRK